MFSLIVWRIRGSSSTRSRGKLTTTSLCFRFTEFSSTVNFVPASSVSPRPYPVMLRICRCKVYRRETQTFNARRARLRLKSDMPSAMDARESLAKGSCRNGHLWDHICADQRPTAEDPSVESPSCCFAWSGVDGCDRCDDSAAGLSSRQLRYAGPVARDD